MLTAIVKDGEEVVATINAPDQARLDKALEPWLGDGRTVEQSGEPEPEGHDLPDTSLVEPE